MKSVLLVPLGTNEVFPLPIGIRASLTRISASWTAFCKNFYRDAVREASVFSEHEALLPEARPLAVGPFSWQDGPVTAGLSSN